MANLSYGFFGVEHDCPVCGKTFIRVNDQWAYMRWSGSHQLWFCSWRCLRKWEATHGDKVERREQIIDLLRQGKTVSEVSKILQETFTKVDYWAKKLEKENAHG